MAELEKKSIDQATIEMIEKAARDDCSTVFDRAAAMKPCPIVAEGSCCSICAMGPCEGWFESAMGYSLWGLSVCLVMYRARRSAVPPGPASDQPFAERLSLDKYETNVMLGEVPVTSMWSRRNW